MFPGIRTRSFLAATLLSAGVAVASAQTPQASSGITTLTFSSSFLGALSSNNVTPSAISPSILTAPNIDFPVIGGSADLANGKGEVIHSGGVALTAGGTTVQLKSFTIDTTGAMPVITGLVVANGTLVGARTPLFNLAVSSISPVQGMGYTAATANNVNVTLTSTAAGLLNSVFGVSAFTGTTQVGTANVFAVLVAGQ